MLGAPERGRTPSQREIAYFLEEFRVTVGICLSPAASAGLPQRPRALAEDFTATLFRLEGLDPVADRHYYAQVRSRVEQVYAGSTHRAD